ncbi:MAG: hypothetical protein R6V84_12355, partial [Desulfobacterales bacterium]
QRPALTPGRDISDEIRQTLSEREGLYRRAMHVCVDTGCRSVEEVCAAVSAQLQEAASSAGDP